VRFAVGSNFQTGVRRLRRFSRAEDGVAAVEFALILPVMLTTYFGIATLAEGYASKQRIELVSRTVSDLTGRVKSDVINAAEINNIATASAAIMAPYETDGMVITLASIVVRKKGSGVEGRVCWSASRRVSHGTLVTVTPPAGFAPNTVVTVPEGYKLASSSYIVSEVKHTYRPVVGDAITGDIAFRDEVPWPVRNVQQIAWEGQAACPVTPIS
jgi:Flp pilus assembly protein TadG